MSDNWMGTGEAIGAAVLKGAAAGSVVPGVGTAIGAAVGLATQVVPGIARWIFGDDGAVTAAAVTQAALAATGAATPEAAVAQMETDQKASEAFRMQVLQLNAARETAAAQAQIDMMKAEIAGQVNAREQELALVQAGSVLAWGAPVVSCLVLLTFGLVVSLALTHSLPAGSDPILNVLLGTLSAMATSVVSYWVGSSAGSASKDQRLGRMGK